MYGPESYDGTKSPLAISILCFAILYPSIIQAYLTHDYQEFAAALLVAVGAWLAFYILARCGSE